MKPIDLPPSLSRARSAMLCCVWMMVLVLLSAASAAGTAAGTVIPNRASSSFIPAGTTSSEAVDSNQVTTELGGSCSVLVTPDGTVANPGQRNSVVPGGSTTFRYEVTNQGNTPNDIAVATIIESASDIQPSSIIVRYDSDGDGVVDTVISNGILPAMPVDTARVVEVEVVVPATAQPNEQIYLNLSAACPNDATTTDDNNVALAVIENVFADLRLDKAVTLSNDADANGLPTPGDTVIFTVTLSNDGPNTATNVVVTDALPSGYTFVSAQVSSGNYEPSTGAWSLASLASGDSAELTVEATINPTGDYVNIAEVTASDQPDPDSQPGDGLGGDANNDNQPDDDADSADPGVGEAADLSLVKTVETALDADGSGTITPGDTLQFTLTVANAGPNDARNVVVTDTLPDGLEYVATSISGGSSQDDSANPLLRWNIDSIVVGANVTLSYQVRVLASGSYQNVAEIEPGTPLDPNPGDNTDTVTPPVEVTPGIRNPTKAADPASGTTLQPGDTLRYTISFSTNDLPVTNAVIRDTFSTYLEGLTIVRTEPAATSQAINGLELVVEYDNIAANTIVRIVVEGTVRDTFDTAAPEIINPGATITFDGGQDTTNQTVHPVLPDTGITTPRKVVSPNNGSAVQPGDRVTYTLTFSSRDVDLADVVIRDTLSENLTDLSIDDVTPAATSQGITGRELEVRYDTLPANTQVTIIFSGTVANTTNGIAPDIENPGATVTVGNGPAVPSNPTINPINEADLYILKRSDRASVSAGSEIVYTIEVGNDGPANANGVSIRDVLPDVLQNASWDCRPEPSDSQASDCDTNGNGNTASGVGDIVIDRSARIAVGEKLIFTVTAQVASDTPDGSLTNTATVTPPDNLTDLNPGNNTDNDETPIASGCALRILPNGTVANPAYREPVPFNEEIVFRYTLENLSNASQTYSLEAMMLDAPSDIALESVRLFRDDGNDRFDGNDVPVERITLGVTTDNNGVIIAREQAVLWLAVVAPSQPDVQRDNNVGYVNVRGFCDNDDDGSPDDGTTADDDNVSAVDVVIISLNIEKMAKPEGGTLNAGETLPYELIVTNNGGFPVRDTVVYDPLPKGLSYIDDTYSVTLYPGEQRERRCSECTFRIVPVADLSPEKVDEIFGPIADRRLEQDGITEDTTSEYAELRQIEVEEVISETGPVVLVWENFPILEPNDSARITFETDVASSLIFEGSRILNPTSARTVSTTDIDGVAASVAVSAAAAVVPVDPDIIQVGSIVLGTAYVDIDDNDVYSEPDIPVQNLRIYLPDGRATTTDVYGRYTFQDLDEGVTSIKVDPITVPGYRLKPTINETAPGFWRTRLYSGLIVRQDIPFEPPLALVAVDETLTATRGDVIVIKELYVQDNGVLVRLTISSETPHKNLTIQDVMPANAQMVVEPVYAGGAPGIGAPVAGEGLSLELGDVPAGYEAVVDYLLLSTQPGREKVALTVPVIEWEWR